MFGLIRLLLVGAVAYAAFRIIRKLWIVTDPKNNPMNHRSSNDKSKEVRTTVFNSEEVQDAKFKDIK